VRIVVAYQAGQGTDVASRYIAERLTKSLGQSFFIENRPGAGGNIGTEAAARAAADGYTLTMGTNATHGTNQFLYDTVPFDAEKDFEPIALIGTFPMAIVANPSFSGNSVADIIAAAKASAKGTDIAMPSTTARIVFELFKAQSQAPVVGIPYKGSGTALSETIGGQVPLAIDTVTAVRPQVAAGKLKAIAVTSQKPTELLPGVKTVAEQGLPGFEVIAWNALYAPKGTPKDVVAVLNAEINKILAQPESRQKLKDLGFDIGGGTPEQLAEFGRAERRKWGPLISAAGIKAE
jgi:tripartite-type tricarboxylate transporter receptor subunit TctC